MSYIQYVCAHSTHTYVYIQLVLCLALSQFCDKIDNVAAYYHTIYFVVPMDEHIKGADRSINAISWPAYHNFPAVSSNSIMVAKIAQWSPPRLLI